MQENEPMENSDAYKIVFTPHESFWHTLFARRVWDYVVVLVLTAIVAAVLYPVFATSRDSCGSSCLSNLKQVGLAMQMYAADYDGVLPCGTRGNRQGGTVVKDTPRQARYHAGQGWAAAVYPYTKNTRIYHCPNEKIDKRGEKQNSEQTPQESAAKAYPVSYAYNRNVAEHNALADLNAPAVTVLMAEVEGARAHIPAPKESSEENVYSPAGNGLSLLTATDGTQSPDVSAGGRYVTGILGGYGQTPACSLPHYSVPYAPLPRHTDGANYLLADGHAKRVAPQIVSPGENALRAEDRQECAYRRAAGTRNLDPFHVTFSTR